MGNAEHGQTAVPSMLATLVVIFALAGGLAACADAATPPPESATVEARPAPTTFALPTLLPTVTRARQQPTATREMPATQLPQSTADLQETVVSFRYVIPALGLDRRLEGNVGGQVTVIDEAVGVAATLQNQGGVLFELQSVLPKMELEDLPEDCPGCIEFSYSLPIAGEKDSGWLQDPVMLASVENYLALTLGPHWPAGTVVGLRRSASPYHVAHTLAITVDGTMYRWLATDPEVAGAEEGTLPPLPAALTELAPEYSVVCPGAPLETLFLAGPPEAAQGITVSISCPAFSLPPSLVPAYETLDGLLGPLLSDPQIPVPPSEIPLTSMVVYERVGQGRLTLLMGGLALVEDSAGEVVTRTLQASTVISVTSALTESEGLSPGVTAYTAAEARQFLLVRTEAGMAEASWDGTPPTALRPAIAALDVLWKELAPDIVHESEGTGTPDVTGTGTPTATGTPTPQITATP